MALANEISYEGKLKCLSETISNKTLEMNRNMNTENNLLKLLSTKSILFIDTSELKNDKTDENKRLNAIEIDIISKLSQIFLKVRDILIILE
jgi:hypothetical protein